MSAAAHLDTALEPSPTPRLALLPTMTRRVSTLGFFVVITLIVAVGLAAVMFTTTSVAAQSKELQRLRREAEELSYQTAALTTQLQTLSSPGSLAMRASDLGMVPNPYPAFLKLSDGTVVGTPQKVQGNEMTWLRIRSQASPETIPSAPVVHAPSSTLPLAKREGVR